MKFIKGPHDLVHMKNNSDKYIYDMNCDYGYSDIESSDKYIFASYGVENATKMVKEAPLKKFTFLIGREIQKKE